MNVNKIAIVAEKSIRSTKPIEEVTQNLSKSTKQIVTEFNDKAGELAGRTRVLINSGKEITVEELNKLKMVLRQKMIDRNFSPNNIEYILSYTNKHNYRVTQAFVDDMYAHTSTICWAVPYTTPGTAHLMEDAVRKRNYDAVYRIKGGQITSTSQIKDMNAEVLANGREYRPLKNTTPAIPNAVFEEEKRTVLDKFKSRGVDLIASRYASCINVESIEVAKALLDDKKMGKDFEYVRWVLPYTNSENAEHMLRAILNKDYQAVYEIQCGRIRNFDTLDARYALLKRFGDQKMTEPPKNDGVLYWKGIDKATALMSFAEDETSAATKVLFEDTFYDFDFIVKILGKINKNNVNEFKEALLKRDLAALEKLCGEKFATNELAEKFSRSKIKIEPPISSTGKISRETFVNYIDDKILNTKGFRTSSLKDSEVRNLAKLLGTTEEQIKNMDRKEYRRLCLKIHPDKNPDDKLADKVFRILNEIFRGQ